MWRFAYIPVSSALRRFSEVLVLCLFASSVTFAISYACATCTIRPPPDSTAPYIDDLVSFYCPDNEYNEIASLFMVSSEVFFFSLR